MHILCLYLCLPASLASFKLAIAAEYYKRGEPETEEIEIDMGCCTYLWFMKVFCCGAPARDESEKVEDMMELDNDGHPKNLPYVENGYLKHPEKMEFEKIEEVM